MASMHFIGLDIHKKAISYCIKDPQGTVLRENRAPPEELCLAVSPG